MPDEGEALIAAAGDELYGLDPAGFTRRRNELAAAARKAGDSRCGQTDRGVAAPDPGGLDPQSARPSRRRTGR